MSSDYLQNYLNKYTYKPNRRNSADLFERVVIASVFLTVIMCLIKKKYI